MASAEVYDAIEQRCRAMMPAVTWVFENEEFALPDTPEPFVYVEIYGGVYAPASIGGAGNDLKRESGQFLAHVMMPNGTGSRAARVIAKQIVDLFFAQDVGGVVFMDASIGTGDPGREFGNYYAMTAAIDWDRDS